MPYPTPASTLTFRLTCVCAAALLSACGPKDAPPAAATEPAKTAEAAPPASALAAVPSLAECSVAPDGIGKAKLGMTYGDFKKAFGDFELRSLLDDDGLFEAHLQGDTTGAIAVLPKPAADGKPVTNPRNALLLANFDLPVLYQKPLPDEAVLVTVSTSNPRCQLAAGGLAPQSFLEDAVQKLGAFSAYAKAYRRTAWQGEDESYGIPAVLAMAQLDPNIGLVLNQPLTDLANQQFVPRTLVHALTVSQQPHIVMPLEKAMMALRKEHAATIATVDDKPPKSNRCTITRERMGQVQLGMTFGQLKAAYAGQLNADMGTPGVLSLGPSTYAVDDQGDANPLEFIHILLDQPTYPGMVPPDSAVVVGAETYGDSCSTAEGLNSQSKLDAFTKAYGAAKISQRPAETAQVSFAKQPAGIRFYGSEWDKRITVFKMAIGKELPEN